MEKSAEKLLSGHSTGGEHCKTAMSKRSSWLQGLADWFSYEKVPVACNHATRTHIGEDLQRYFYAACFGKVHRRSPKLSNFPTALWPEHKNVTEQDPDDFIFEDRFRVQLRDFPATTVTSHISKDGHCFIHYDPTQCRSLTVREAARLQTFPDTYFFAGPRTAQYQQVGNAVPPILARQIAEQIYMMLNRNSETCD
jgi:DNA (cytosine-5)-methyltransferase 1